MNRRSFAQLLVVPLLATACGGQSATTAPTSAPAVSTATNAATVAPTAASFADCPGGSHGIARRCYGHTRRYRSPRDGGRQPYRFTACGRGDRHPRCHERRDPQCRNSTGGRGHTCSTWRCATRLADLWR